MVDAFTVSLNMERNARYQACMREVDAALDAGDTASAIRLAKAAVREGFEHPVFLNLFAHGLMQQNQYGDALKYTEYALTLAPQNSDILNTRGICLYHLDRGRDAISSYDAALLLAPGTVEIRFNKALAHQALGEFDTARSQLEQVIALQPAHIGALTTLAMLAAHRSDLPLARARAAEALRIDPHAYYAITALATADLAEKDFAAAKQRLLPLTDDPAIDPVNRAPVYSLLGDALDGLDDTHAAFQAYKTSKAILREFFAQPFAGPGVETALMRARRMIEYFKNAPTENWVHQRGESADKAHDRRTHVFLVGFPRSGTTLLEQILGSHPSIETMEEKHNLADANAAFFLPTDGLDRLASIGEKDAAHYREAYWNRVAQSGALPTRGAFIDKLPLNSISLCVMAKLFPDAKILFAIREPRDVVFSCFRRRFAMNAHMYEFTTLEGAAEYYDAVMTLAMLYREKLGLDIHDIRCKDVLADLEGEVSKVCAFLGLEWDDAMAGFAKRAQERGTNTPSSTQVIQGLYREGFGQWRRYRTELEPVLPRLRPWVEHFGYSPE